jgi:hypothetical protein
MITEKDNSKDMKYHAIAENIILSSNLTDDHFIKLSFALFNMFKVRKELGELYSGLANLGYLQDVLAMIASSDILTSYLNSTPKQTAFVLGSDYEMPLCHFYTSLAFWSPPLGKTSNKENADKDFENFPAEFMNIFNVLFYFPGNLPAAQVDSCDKNEGRKLYEKLKYHKNAYYFFQKSSEFSENGGILQFLSSEEIAEQVFWILEEKCDTVGHLPMSLVFGYFMKDVLLKDDKTYFTEIAERIKSKLVFETIELQKNCWLSLGQNFMSTIPTVNFIKLTDMMFAVLAEMLKDPEVQKSNEKINKILQMVDWDIFCYGLRCSTKTVLGIMIKMYENPQISYCIRHKWAQSRLFKFLFIKNANPIGLRACQALKEELPSDAVLRLGDLKSQLRTKRHDILNADGVIGGYSSADSSE